MKILCLRKDTGKRRLVDTIEEPNYKEIYLKEDGSSFCEKTCKPETKPAPGMVELTPELMEEMVEDYQCGNCDKKYKTLKGVEKHLTKCK